LYAAIAAFMFWIIETSWKTFQYANYARVREIEAFMRGETTDIRPLQIATSWGESIREGGLQRFMRMMFWKHVIFPHGIMSFLLCLLYYFITK
jgi:hypothetical protein